MQYLITGAAGFIGTEPSTKFEDGIAKTIE